MQKGAKSRKKTHMGRAAMRYKRRMPKTPPALRVPIQQSWNVRMQVGQTFFTSSSPIQEAKIFLATTIPELLSEVRTMTQQSSQPLPADIAEAWRRVLTHWG